MSPRAAWLVLVALLGAYFAPVVLRGEVIFAHDNARELSTAPIPTDRISTRYFADQSSAYLPEVEVQMHGPRSGWISTWNPHVELGRPTGQLSGFGKAFLPMQALTLVTDDALRVTTWLTVLAVCAAGLFGMAFLRALGLVPAAALTGAVGLSLGVYTTFWLTFPMFVWGIAWTLGILWLTIGFVERPGPARFVGLAFCTNALLLSAYPQQVVWHAYALAGFALVRVARREGPRAARIGVLLGLGAAALVGALGALPVFLDLALESARSGRGAVAPSFYLPSIPRIAEAADLWLTCATRIDPFLWGNPLAQDAPFDVNLFKGVSWTPFLAGLIACSLLGPVRRRAWGWQLLVGGALLLTLCPPAFLLAVRFAGLSLSRFPPLAGAWIPAMVLAAYAADGLLRAASASPALLRAALAAAPGTVAIGCALLLGPPLDLPSAAFSVALVLGAALFAWRPRPALLGALTLATALGYGWRLRLVRPVDTIRLDSPLCERLRELTADGSRYALTGENIRVLPPNQEALHGLRSIHTYDALASRGYRDWVETISPGGMSLHHWGAWEGVEGDGGPDGEDASARPPAGYGRQFRRVVPGSGLVDPMLSFSGVGVVISDGTHDPSIAAAGRDGVLVTEPRPILEATLLAFEDVPGDPAAVRVPGSLRDVPSARCERVADEGDRLRFEVARSSVPTLLFVSQQHHPRWRAVDQDGAALETAAVNGVWLGVRMPPGTSAVELAFLPHVRLAWVPEVLFLVAAAACAAWSVLRGLSAARAGARAAGTR